MAHDEGCGKPEDRTELRPTTCQVCGEALSEKAVVLCHRCKTPHHEDCWRYNRGCAVYGCGCRTSEKPSPADLDGVGRFVVDAPPSLVTFFVLLTISILGFAGGMAGIAVSPWALAFAIPWYVTTLTLSILYQSKGRFRLTFDSERGVVTRRFICGGRSFGAEETWLRADEVAEVHLHRYSQNQLLRVQELWLALVDGRRESITKMRVNQGAGVRRKARRPGRGHRRLGRHDGAPPRHGRGALAGRDPRGGGAEASRGGRGPEGLARGLRRCPGAFSEAPWPRPGRGRDGGSAPEAEP